MSTADSNHRSALDRFLGVFTDVHAGEGFTALLLALNRKLCQYDRAMRKGVWDRPAGRPITPLDGETAGLVGLGAIGQALARRLQRCASWRRGGCRGAA